MDNDDASGFRGGRRCCCARVWRQVRPPRTPVKIGVIYPLSGNSASAGNYSKMAIEVGADVINNGNADLAKIMPLAKGGGLPGLGGAKIQLIFADNQGTPAAGQNQALRLISEEKVAALIGAYQSGITLTASAIAERHGIPVPHRRIGRGQPHRARLQVVLPHHAGRHRLRARLFDLPQGAEGGGPEGRLDRAGAREHRVRQLGRQRHRRPVRQGRPARSRQKIAYSANSTRRAAAGAAAQGEEPRRRDLHLLHVGRDPLHQDDEGADWKPGDHDRRQCRLQRSGLREEHGRLGRGPGQPLDLRRRQAGQRAGASSTSSTRRRPAATISTTCRRAACRASWCWPTPSTARARPIRPRSGDALKATNLPAEPDGRRATTA